jgi:hypothetical protein
MKKLILALAVFGFQNIASAKDALVLSGGEACVYKKLSSKAKNSYGQFVLASEKVAGKEKAADLRKFAILEQLLGASFSDVKDKKRLALKAIEALVTRAHRSSVSGKEGYLSELNKILPDADMELMQENALESLEPACQAMLK